MKALSIILIVVCSFLQALGNTYHYSFSTEDFQINTNKEGDISVDYLKGIAIDNEAGMPDLPLISSDIIIPDKVKYITSSISKNIKLLKNNVTFALCDYPVPTNHAFNEDYNKTQRTIDDEKMYGVVDFTYVGSSEWENVTVLHFIICPFVYDESSRDLYLIENMTVEIETEHYGGIDELPFLYNTDILDNFSAKNYMEFSKSYNEPLKTISNIDFNVYPWSNPEYLIVTNEELAPHFKKLAQWKISKGIPSHIVTMKEIENAFNDSTPQLKLKKYLYSVYNKGNLKYVLLGGDDTVVPVQYCYGIVHTGSKSSQVEESRTILADIYYACFGNQFDWDKNKNGIYGEYDDLIDASPSIYISRLPLSTVQDVNSYISKLIEYERNPRWNNNLLMTGTKLHGMNNDSTHSDAELLSDIIYSNAIKPYWNGILTKYFDTSADFTLEGFNGNLSDGYSFVTIESHGMPTFYDLGSYGKYYTSQIRNNKNDYNGIILTSACHTNAFDRRGSTPCISQEFMKNSQNKILAYFGCSRLGWSSGNALRLGPSQKYEEAFFKTLFSNKNSFNKFGEIVNKVKYSMVGSSGGCEADRWLFFGLNPIGDPEMQIYTKIPESFKDYSISNDDGVIVVDTGIEGCDVCVMSSNDGKAFYKVFKDTRKIEVPDSGIDYRVCVSKPNYIPLSMSLNVDKIQNEQFSGRNYIKGDDIIIGSSVTEDIPYGEVVFINGSTEINGNSVVLDKGTTINIGTEMIIKTNK